VGDAQAWSQGKVKPEDHPEAWEVSFEGAVLAVWECNFHDDSDFWYAAWDGEKVVEGTYATTRGWTYANGAVVDATAEVIAAAEAWAKPLLAASAVTARNAKEKVVAVGKQVEVFATKAQKKSVGFGTVFWVGPDRYKSSRWGTVYRVGVELDGERVFTNMANVAVIGGKEWTAEECWPQGQVSFHRWGESLVYQALAAARAESLAEDGYASRVR
jgi:hypothetical protein